MCHPRLHASPFPRYAGDPDPGTGPSLGEARYIKRAASKTAWSLLASVVTQVSQQSASYPKATCKQYGTKHILHRRAASM